MTPIAFDGCFGWLHPGSTTYGVILCSSFGGEETHMHGAWRKLAQRFADTGMPTLRFDYLGTGDSIEDEERPGRVRAWLDSVIAAVRWLRENAGVQEVGLVGLSLGAFVATAAAEEIGGVDALVLLAPPERATFFRALKASDRITEQPSIQQPLDYIEAKGFFYTAETIRDIETTLLRDISHPANRVLIVTCDGAPTDTDLGDCMRGDGIEVREAQFPEFRWMAEYSPDLTETVVGWMRRDRQPVPLAINEYSGKTHIRLQDACETALFLRPPCPLFGMLCEPAVRKPDAPTLVFSNVAAGIRHIGVNRLWVTMARRFAALGFTSLRFDVAGMGDSAYPSHRPSPPPHAEDSCDDVQTVLDWLAEQGHSGAVLVGLCRSADLAYQVSALDRRVVGQVLINLPRANSPNLSKTRETQYADLSSRPIETLIVLSSSKYGLELLENTILANGKSLKDQPNVQVEVMDDAGHIFLKRSERHELIAIVEDYIVDRYLGNRPQSV